MRIRGLVAVGTIVLLAGCSSGGESRKPVPIPSDPVVAFAGAKAQLGKESARFGQDTGTDWQTFTGVADAKTKNWELTGKDYVVRRIGTDVYLRMSGQTLERSPLPPAEHDHLAAGKWVRTHLPEGREIGGVEFNDAFPWNLANPAINATGLTRTADRSFAGDLTIKHPSMTKKKPDTHAKVSVDLDEHGRFAKITLNLDPTKKPAVFSFSDFGLRADVEAPPPADVLDDQNSSILNETGIY